jgi:hypothetical protein
MRTSARRFAPGLQVAEATAEYRPCWSRPRAPAAAVQGLVRRPPLAPAKLRPNPSLERRPHEAGHLWPAAGSRRLHCRLPAKGVLPRGSPQLARWAA